MYTCGKYYRSLLLYSLLTLFSQPHVWAQESTNITQNNPFLPSSSTATPTIGTNYPSSARSPSPVLALPTPPVFANYKLNYVPVAEIQKTLQDLCASSKVTSEPLSNNLLFLGSEQEKAMLEKALSVLDQPTSQVTLEAKVISLTREDSKSLGVRWSWDMLPQKISDSSSTDDNDSSSSSSQENQGNFRFFHDYSFKFGATLNALVAKGRAKILASPHIVTLPGKEGKIFIGDHIPVQIEKHASNYIYNATEFVDAGIKLNFTPIFDHEENMLTAKVFTEVSTPTMVAELKNYKVTQRQVDTTVRMRSGETLVIGGLITEEEQRSLQKIPFLGDIPILGNLFKNRTHTKNSTEIMLLLTPYITTAGTSPAIYTQKARSIKQADITTTRLE